MFSFLLSLACGLRILESMRLREPGICLRTTDYSETSQVLQFLTRGAGVVRLLGKGTKRPKSSSGGAIDLLAEGELLFIRKNTDALGTLVEFTETVSHSNLRVDAARLNTSLYMIELVSESLPEADPYPEVFDLLHGALGRVPQPDAPLQAVLAYFQWRLLRCVGLLGGMEACVSCGTPVSELSKKRPSRGEICFSSRLGGILCEDCHPSAPEKFQLQPPTLGALAALAAAEEGRKVFLPDTQARPVNRLLAYHITHQLGKKLRMAKYVIDKM